MDFSGVIRVDGLPELLATELFVFVQETQNTALLVLA